MNTTPGSRRGRADTAEKVFTWGVFAYVVIRAIPIWRGLEDGNVNPWVFLGLDLATAYPYAKSWPRLFRSLTARRMDRFIFWLLVLLGSFVLPYLYVALVGDDVARWVWIVLWAFVAVGLAGAALRVRGALRERRT